MMGKPNIIVKQLFIVFFFCGVLTLAGYFLAAYFADFLSFQHTERYLTKMEERVGLLWTKNLFGVAEPDLMTAPVKKSMEKFGQELMRFPGISRVDIYNQQQERLWSISERAHNLAGKDFTSEKFTTTGIDLRDSHLYLHVPVGGHGAPQAVAVLVYLPEIGEIVALVSSKTFLALFCLIVFGVLALYAIFSRLNKPFKLQNQELTSILAATPQGIATFDNSLRVLSANRRFHDLCASSDGDVKTHLFEACPGISESKFLTLLKKAMRSGKGSGDIVHLIGKKNLVYRWEIVALPNDISKEKQFLMLLDDVTEKKNLLEHLSARQKELEKKNEFLAIVLHQIRSPLADVRWVAESLNDDDFGKLNKNQKESVKSIEGSVKRLSETISGLTTLFGVESGPLETVKDRSGDLVQVIRDVLADLQASIKSKSLDVEVTVPSRVPLVRLDNALLRQVVLNYSTNSIRYSKTKGKIAMRLIAEKDGVRFEVSDDGIGIPKKEQNKIFTKFYRASNAIQAVPEGTGLGLALVKSIMNFCSGTFGFTSSEGKGAVFYAKFPLSGQR